MTMIDATLLGAAGFNTLVALAGALIGMAAAVFAVRSHFESQRALAVEHDLRESLERLERRPRREEAIEEAIGRQVVAAERMRGYVRQRSFFHRLLLGYAALIGLALLFVWFLVDGQHRELGGGTLRWFWVGLLAAGLLNGVVYAISALRDWRFSWLALSVEAVRIPPGRETALPSELELEAPLRGWLREQGFEVRSGAPRSGFDLIGRHGDEQVLIEIKSVPRLSVDDIDAAAGAAARTVAKQADVSSRVVVAAPAEALAGNSAALAAADALGVQIYAIGRDGEIHARP